MTKTQEPRVTPQAGSGSAWTGWTIFASLMLAVVGGFNLIQGCVALLDESYFVANRGNQLLIAGFTKWGWILVVWGIVQIAAGLGLNSGKGWARWAAVVVACVSSILQTLFLAAYPLWSITIITLDVIVIYALVIHWQEARDGL